MPIRPENQALYPDNWPQIRAVILEREKNRCKFCGVANYAQHPVTGSKVVLTIAHLNDPDPANVDPENLAALCQRCHNQYDAPMRLANRRARERAELEAAGQKTLPFSD